MREEDIKDLSVFLKEFQSETDRGAALVGAALIDEKLLNTLDAFMVKGDVSKSLLNGGFAPLGSFSARIKASFALGLIDMFEFSECEIIRKTRNEFAHRTHGTSFKDEKIENYCNRLQSDLPDGRQAFEGNPRGVFINAVVLTALRLTYRSEWVRKEKRQTRRWP